MDKKYILSLLSITMTTYSLQAMVLFGPPVTDNQGKQVIIKESMIASPRTLEQNAREAAAQENLSESEDTDEWLTNAEFLKMINARDENMKGKPANLGHFLVSLSQAPLENIVVINAPSGPRMNPGVKNLIRHNLTSVIEAATWDNGTFIIDYTKTYFQPDVLDSSSSEEENENEEDSGETESSTQEKPLSLLQALGQASREKITFRGFTEGQAYHLEAKSKNIVESLASAERAVEEIEPGEFCIDLSKIVSFPLAAAVEETNLSEFLQLQSEEIKLTKDGQDFNGTSVDKLAVQTTIKNMLKSITKDEFGNVTVDVDKVLTTAPNTTKAPKEKSFLQKVGVPALKYGSCVALGYLAFKLGNSH